MWVRLAKLSVACSGCIIKEYSKKENIPRAMHALSRRVTRPLPLHSRFGGSEEITGRDMASRSAKADMPPSAAQGGRRKLPLAVPRQLV